MYPMKQQSFLFTTNFLCVYLLQSEYVAQNNPYHCWTSGSFAFKACVRYFLSNFYFSPNDSP